MMGAPVSFPPDACWIGSAHPFDLQEVYTDFRAPDVRLVAPPAQAIFWITADSRYRLWINGEFVARGPARCHPWQQSVDPLDVAAFLHAGRNSIAVQVYQPGYSHFAYTHRGAAGLLANLTCDGQTALVTSTAWRVRRNPSFHALVPRVSIYGSGVEDRDLRLDDEWQAPHYDASGWHAPRIVAPVGGYPWLELHTRLTPLLHERELPLHLVEVRTGPLDGAVEPHLALRRAWQGGADLPATDSGADPNAALDANSNPDTSTGADTGWYGAAGGVEGTGWLFDLGRAHACQAWVEVQGAAEGQTLLVSYAEKLRDGELVLSDPATYCRVRMTDRYRLAAGDQVAAPFAMRGGRYLLFWLTGSPAGACRLRFHARGIEYPLGEVRPLATDEPELQQIAHMCENTLAACLQDSFVDSTWRESSLWIGDALPQALILHAMTGDTRPLRQAITLAAAGAYPDGVLPSVLPGEVHAYAIVDYNFMWVELLALYLELTDDAALVTELWPTLVALLDCFDADVAPDGLIRSQPGRRLFLDWAPVSRQEPSAIYNLHYLLALRTAAALAEKLMQLADQSRWTARADRLRGAVRAAFLHAGCWWDDLSRTTFSQLAGSFAVLAGAVEEDEVSPLLARIAARSLDAEDNHIAAGIVLASPFMHYYIFAALQRHGRAADILAIIRLRWGRWAAAGCPTTWENWNVDFPDGSECHAFSAHPRYFLAQIAQAGDAPSPIVRRL